MIQYLCFYFFFTWCFYDFVWASKVVNARLVLVHIFEFWTFSQTDLASYICWCSAINDYYCYWQSPDLRIHRLGGSSFCYMYLVSGWAVSARTAGFYTCQGCTKKMIWLKSRAVVTARIVENFTGVCSIKVPGQHNVQLIHRMIHTKLLDFYAKFLVQFPHCNCAKSSIMKP